MELHDLIKTKSSIGMTVEDVTYIVCVGHKRSNYLSCDARRFSDGGNNVMSMVYDPSNYKLYSAWDGNSLVTIGASPAACNNFEFDLKECLNACMETMCPNHPLRDSRIMEANTNTWTCVTLQLYVRQ